MLAADVTRRPYVALSNAAETSVILDFNRKCSGHVESISYLFVGASFKSGF
jgi:hypothetical protein